MAKIGENITRRKDGRWETRIVLGYHSNGNAIYRSLYAKTRAEILLKRRQFLSSFQMPHGNFPLPFGEVLKQYLNRKQHFVKSSTLSRYRILAETHLLPILGNLNCREITSSVVEAFAREKLRSGRLDHNGGLSAKTVRDLLSLLCSVLSFADEDFRRPETPGLRKLLTAVPPLTIFSPEEQKRLTESAVRDCKDLPFGILLSLYMGMRIGEICALRWEGLNLEQAWIRIDQTLLRIKTFRQNGHRTEIVMNTPKSRAGIRILPIPEFLIDPLRHRRLNAEPSDFFLTGTKHFIEPSSYYRKYRKWLTEWNIPPHSFHALRHTFATRCIEKGCDPKTLSEMLGHANVQFTLSRYVHPSMDLKRHFFNRLSQ